MGRDLWSMSQMLMPLVFLFGMVMKNQIKFGHHFDVLAEAASRAEFDNEELQVMRNWLGELLFSQEFAKLGQGGHKNTQIPLQNVFIDLPTSREQAARGNHFPFLRSFLESGGTQLKAGRWLTSPHGSSIEVESVDDDLGRSNKLHSVLLMGGPGQGKSTLGQLACQLHRALLLSPARSHLTSGVRQLVESVLSASEWRRSEETEFSLDYISPALPIQIALPEFAQWISKRASDEHVEMPELLTFLSDAPSARSVGVTSSLLLRLMFEMPVLLVLDGFDEVGSVEDRARIVRAARSLLIRQSESEYRCQLLATTRPQGYSDELSSVGIPLAKINLVPLGKREALAYAEKLINEKLPSADQRAKAVLQIQAAAEEPATERLLTTPLQVTIMTALVQQLGRAPRERWNLFERYFSYTFDREIERNTYASPLLAEYRAHIERIHARVGLLLQVESEHDGGASARMSRDRLAEVAAEVLREDEIEDVKNGTSLVGEIISYAETRLVFLVEPEPGKFGFEIRSLQEFMAAFALTSGRDSEIESRLAYVSRAPKFRNVTLFIAGRLFSQASILRDYFADVICVEMDSDRNDPIMSVIMAGARLALETLEQGGAATQPKRARALMARAVLLIDLPINQDLLRVVDVANDDTAQVLSEALEFRIRNADSAMSRDFYWAYVCYGMSSGADWAYSIWAECSENYPPSSGLIRILRILGSNLAPVIWDFVLENASDFPIEATLAPPRGYSKAQEPEGWLGWVRANFSHRRSLGESNLFWVVPLRGDRDDLQLDLPHLRSDFPESWKSWGTLARFESAPSMSGFVDAIRIFENSQDISYWKSIARHRVSWPLAAVLAWAESTEDLKGIALAAEAGLLGSVDLWMDCQKKWSDFSLEQCLSNLDLEISSGLPWSVDSIGVTPPTILSFGWSNPHSEDPDASTALSIMQRASDLLSRTSRSDIRDYLSSICLASWISAEEQDRNGWPIKDWVRDSGDAASQLLEQPHSVNKEEWMSLLALCKSNEAFHFGGEPGLAFRAFAELPLSSTILSICCGSFFVMASKSVVSTEDVELLRSTLSSLRREGHFDGISDLRYVALEIMSGALPSSVAPVDVISQFFADGVGKDYVHLLVKSLRWSALPLARVESLVVELCRSSDRNSNYARELYVFAASIFQRRFSNLDSSLTWDRLSLPLPYPENSNRLIRRREIPESPVVVSRIQLDNVAGIGKVCLDLAKPSEGLGQWTVIVGPNGVGKTTLLRSLALALRSVSNPSIWPRGAFSVHWKSAKVDRPAEIQVELLGGSVLSTSVRSMDPLSIVQSPPLDLPRIFPLFAYGCRRGSALGGPLRQVDLGEDDGPEIATLFDEGAALVQAETWLVALDGDAQKSQKSRSTFEAVRAALCEILAVRDIAVRDQRVVVEEQSGIWLHVSNLSDGYLTSMGWFLDVVARWLSMAEQANFEIGADFMREMRGLVLIDEIDLHLHPQWQVDVITRTRAILPQMSFVVTTHNPLTLVGAAASEIWIMEKSDGEVAVRSGIESPMMLSGGQLYRRYFGISDIYPAEIGRMINRASILSGYSWRDKEEEVELSIIMSNLAGKGVELGWSEPAGDSSD